MGTRLSLAALVALGTVLEAQSAHATAAAPSAPRCLVGVGSSFGGLTLPANAPALMFYDASRGGLSASAVATVVSGETRTSIGEPVTDSHGMLTLPLPKLGVGAYTLELAMSCSDGTASPLLEEPMLLTEAVDLPTEVGELFAEGSVPPTGVEVIRFKPSAGIRAFLAATRLSVAMDGRDVARSIIDTRSEPLTLYDVSVNAGEACVENGVLHRDKRTVEVTVSADIAGVADSPKAAKLDVEVDCGAIQWTDGLTAGGEPPTSTPPSSDQGSSSSGGCSSAPSPAGAPVAPAGLALAAILAMRRRRRA